MILKQEGMDEEFIFKSQYPSKKQNRFLGNDSWNVF
jgi:hypothetical protein